jgi:hypothetical protein
MGISLSKVHYKSFRAPTWCQAVILDGLPACLVGGEGFLPRFFRAAFKMR